MDPNLSNSEKEWYDLLAKGDQETMAKVFSLYYSRLCYFAENITENADEAEDLAMKALAVLWEQAKAGVRIDRIESYLFTIVRNGCYDYLKHQKVKSNSIHSLSLDVKVEDIIEASLVQEDIIEKIYQEIKNLPEKCRQVAELTYVHGLSSEETSRLLNISSSTVRSQKARAINLLRTILVKKKFFLMSFL